ncbi:transcription factor bhlh36 [Quercus suber]|uniref:Transcription factor bhlh36 n=1 Tax=Quercus suber TaxID=58331 RepID=A0AAW0JB48_QUESU
MRGRSCVGTSKDKEGNKWPLSTHHFDCFSLSNSSRSITSISFSSLIYMLEAHKGKRSALDLINEAANYIKHMTEKIQGLQVERDQLKNLSNSTAFIPGIESWNNCSLNYATVRVSEAGVEILMSSWLREEGFLLSKVLELLLEEGLSVIRCASNKTNERLFLTIQSEVCDPTCFNLSELQQKLNAMCNYGVCNSV